VRIGEAPKAFDTIAPAYDETRDPLDPATIAEVSRTLRAQGVASLLEVGVGTGRVAEPLGRAGLRVTGVDASRGMLARAHAKGLSRLVRGSAYQLPFADGAADAAIFVHVLHLLDEPFAALREATRVGRLGAFALVHPRRPDGERDGESPDGPRRIVYRLLAERGYPVPERGQGGPPQRERALLERAPPDRLTVVSDRTVTEPVAKRLEMLARGASRHTMHIPRDELARAVDRARAEVGDRTFTYRRVEALALWSARTVAVEAERAVAATGRTGAP
jgi:SAM-dependent methyltransferase